MILLACCLLGAGALSLLGQKLPSAAAPGGLMDGQRAEARVIEVTPKTNALGRTLTLTVTNLARLITDASVKQKKIVLFVDGNELTDVLPIGMDLGSSTLRFELQRTTKNKGIWFPLLGRPIQQPVRPLKLSVGLQGETPLLVDNAARDTWLFVIGWNGWTIVWTLVFVALLIVFFLLAIYSDILRVPEPDDTGRFPYSLSRAQAAFWLFLTAESFVFIWVVSGDLSTLNTSVLALIGISAGTYLASVLVDKPTVNQALGAGAVPAGPPAPAAGAALVAPVQATPATGNIQKAVTRIQNIRFVGRFLGDILSDDKGISVHRFQIFVWTIVLGIIFVVSVVNELSMPEFSGTLLALMGISSATYVGAKMAQ